MLSNYHSVDLTLGLFRKLPNEHLRIQFLESDSLGLNPAHNIQESYFPFPCLNFLICKLGIINVPSLVGLRHILLTLIIIKPFE